MASAHISAALRAPAHPMAKAGYGKRHAPDQAPPHARDFGHLATREAAIGAYIDRLPEGAAIGYKTLAEELPDYGQQACRSALDRLTREGHLRRIKVHLTGANGTLHWVTRTYFSRTARNAAWWAEFVRFVRGIDVTGQPPAPAAVADPGLPNADPRHAGDPAAQVPAGRIPGARVSAARVSGAAPWQAAHPAGAGAPAEQPAAEQPAAECPAADPSAAEPPSAEGPLAEGPVAEGSAVEGPGAEDPAAEGPGAEDSLAEGPGGTASVVASLGDLMAGRMDAPPPGSAAALALDAPPFGSAAATAPATAPAPEPGGVEPGTRAPRSEAYDVLAALGARDPRLQLSGDECFELEPLVGEWLDRGVGRDRITHALASGLPTSVHSAVAFLRTRLENKMPPTQQPGPRASHPAHEEIAGAVMMCLFCDEDETTTTLVGGVCGDCRAAIDRDEANGATGDVPDTFLARPRHQQDVAARVAELRAASGRPATVPVPRRK
ncbi:hypothetical protein ABZ401_28440 [Streptomyces sp. NPDC005892]|uniref:hypothetical protein n=1 Tax=Streptomyces sp. NPDC005892 TaxID=3155593 RepID=UPI003408281E